MKPYRLLLVAVALAFSSITYAQQDSSHYVIGSAGDVFDDGSIFMSFTVGEPVIQTIGAGNTFLTQGFHQDKMIISTIAEIPQLMFDMRAYPNPAAKAVYFDPGGAKNLNLSLRDMLGIEIHIEWKHYRHS